MRLFLGHSIQKLYTPRRRDFPFAPPIPTTNIPKPTSSPQMLSPSCKTEVKKKVTTIPRAGFEPAIFCDPENSKSFVRQMA